MRTMSGRQFNQASSEARRRANDAPLFITDRGKPAHVLMSYEYYLNLQRDAQNIADLLALDEDMEVPVRSHEQARGADFS